MFFFHVQKHLIPQNALHATRNIFDENVLTHTDCSLQLAKWMDAITE